MLVTLLTSNIRVFGITVSALLSSVRTTEIYEIWLKSSSGAGFLRFQRFAKLRNQNENKIHKLNRTRLLFQKSVISTKSELNKCAR